MKETISLKVSDDEKEEDSEAADRIMELKASDYCSSVDLTEEEKESEAGETMRSSSLRKKKKSSMLKRMS